jgi:hypothetical protein
MKLAPGRRFQSPLQRGILSSLRVFNNLLGSVRLENTLFCVSLVATASESVSLDIQKNPWFMMAYYTHTKRVVVAVNGDNCFNFCKLNLTQPV